MTGHAPVMVAEALRWLEPARGGVFVDCTLGLGGHSQALLEGGASRVIAIDRDTEAIAMARERLDAYGIQLWRPTPDAGVPGAAGCDGLSPGKRPAALDGRGDAACRGGADDRDVQRRRGRR